MEVVAEEGRASSLLRQVLSVFPTLYLLSVCREGSQSAYPSPLPRPSPPTTFRPPLPPRLPGYDGDSRKACKGRPVSVMLGDGEEGRKAREEGGRRGRKGEAGRKEG